MAEGSEAKSCQPCMEMNSSNNATSFCVQCIEYMCDNCLQNHTTQDATESHMIIRSDIPTNVQVCEQIKQMPCCLIHKDMKVTHRCEAHGIDICSTCKENNHRTCELTVSLSEDLFSLDNETENITRKLCMLQDKTKSVLEQQNTHLKDFQDEKVKIHSQIETFVTKLTEEVMQMKENIENEVDQVMEAEMKILSKNQDEMKTYEAETMRYQAIADAINRFKIKVVDRSLLRVLWEKISTLEESVGSMRIKQPPSLHFVQNDFLPRITRLGTIKIDGCLHENDTNKQTKCNVKLQSTELSSVVTGLEYNEEKASQHHIRIHDDHEDCSVLACVVLNDGCIVLIDGENNKLKLFEPCFKFADVIRFNEPPVDICLMGRNKVAVIYKNMKRIDQYSVRNRKLTFWHGVQTRHRNLRIAENYTYQQFWLLCKDECANNGRIQLREYDGMVLIDISLDSIASPAEMRVEDCRISYTTGGLILVSKNTGVICMQPTRNLDDLKTKWRIPLHGNIESVSNVSSDRNGRIYICSSASKSIYQVSRHQTQMIVTGICDPVTLSIDNRCDRIIVGRLHDNFVHVYSL